MSRRPPLLGRWLLRRALPTGPVAEGIAGDLEQEYMACPRRLWYLRQVVGIILHATHDRWRGRSWFVAAAGRAGAPAGAGTRAGTGAPAGRARPPRRAAAARRAEELWQDLRFAARTLAQRPLFTAVAIGTLAAGMGINTAIFSVVNGLLLRPIPAIEDPQSLVEIARGTGDDYVDVAWGAFQAVRTGSTTLQDVAGWDGITLAYRDGGDVEAAVLSGREVTGNYFSVLGVQPAAGRFFDPDRFWPDVAAEVVITDHVWQQRYGGSPDAIGRQVFINGTPATIVGVAPAGFGGHQVLVERDIFVPIGMPAPGMLSAADLSSVRSGFFVLLGRMKDGAGIEAVREEVSVLGDRFFADNGIAEPYRLRVDPYGALPVTDRATVSLVFALLLLITTTVMAIACVNVANMQLSRGLERRREIAIRVSLGAGRGRVARQLLTESLLLFLLAAGAALTLAAWTTDLLVRLYLPRLTSTRLFLDVSIDARVLGFALGTAVITGVVFGLAPALAATRKAPTLRRGSAARRAPRLRSALVAGQVALTVVLLVAAGLMVRTLAALRAIDLGFDVDGVYLVELDLQHGGYDEDGTRVFYAQLLEAVRALPSVEAAATARKPPMASVSGLSGIYPDGIEPPAEYGFGADFNRVSDGYFRTVGIPLLAGREFTPADDDRAPAVAIVNASMANRVWGSTAVVGRRLTIGRGDAAVRYEVVGVAADAHYHTFVEQTPSFLYLAAAQRPDTIGHVMVRGDLAGTLGAVRAEIARLDRDVPVVEVAAVQQIVDGYAMGQRLAAWVSGVVGLVGLLLGSVGVYGVTAFAVGQRSHEIGVRMALGARAADVRRLMLRRGMRAPLAGMAMGLLLAAAAAQLAGSLLHQVGTLDPWTYGVVVVVLGGVALLATLLPARRAAAMDPVQTLRSE